MSTQIRTAIIGPGKVAHTHARILAALPQSHFVAVCGRNAERTTAFAKEYGVQGYTDLQTMLRDADVEMVIVCTPHPLHAEQAIVAAEAGAHVLIEKPMAITVADCDRMIAAARQTGVKLGVISQRRLYPAVQRVRSAIDNGKIGLPILGTLTLLGWRGPEYYAMDAWRGTRAGEGGGVLVNQAVHQLDLFQWLMGPIAEVSAYVANLNHPTIEVEDTAVAIVKFRSGALGAIVASNSQNPGLYGNIHIHGANGSTIGVQTDGGSMFISGVTNEVEPPVNDIWTVPEEAERLAEWQTADRSLAHSIDIMSHYHQLQIADFLDAINDHRAALVDGDEGRKAVELFEAIYRSNIQQQPIRLPLLDAFA
jgi:predicted dehydrogenase